jgi:hypothetical protein
MPTSFEPGCDDDIDPGFVKSNGFVWSRGRPDGEDPLGATFIEDFP